ncbi:ABC transporter permease [Candidatus Leptofilum sp.]|uniref:ABC transporter permease n=1 Tax=Candidatus Leptofilum sp. TaxID=3241576 RepID=UPI003B5C8E39
MNEQTQSPAQRILQALAPVLIALLFTAVIIIAVGQSPIDVFNTFVSGAFGSSSKIADTFVIWVSLAIVSAGLLVTFRAGQWNIGVEGQVVMGAIGAVGMSRLLLESPAILAIPLMLIGGVILGAVWGILVGLLKIHGGVNEIFGGLATNFVASGLTIYLVAGPWKPEGSSSVSTSELLPRTLWLPTLEGLRVSVYSIILAILVVIAIYLALRGTIWGLQLKAVGRNLRGAAMLGVPTNRILMSAYIVCGLCAGLVGGLLVTGVRHQLVTNISSGYGFLGILIVLLTGFRGALIAPIAFFFAVLGIGSVPLQLRLGLDSALGGVLQGVIVLSFELVQGWRQRVQERRGLETAVATEGGD